MYKKQISILIICIQIILITKVSAQSNSVDTLKDNYGAGMMDIGYYLNENSQAGYLSMGFMISKNRFEYRYPIIPFSIVKRDSETYRYGFQLPVQLTFMGIAYGINQIFNPGDTTDMVTNPSLMTYIALAPNSSIQYKIGRYNLIGISTHTHYLLVRLNGLDRGILFTPSFDFTIGKDNQLVGRFGVTFSVTYSLFWNFEGESNSDGVGFKFNFYADMTSH